MSHNVSPFSESILWVVATGIVVVMGLVMTPVAMIYIVPMAVIGVVLCIAGLAAIAAAHHRQLHPKLNKKPVKAYAYRRSIKPSARPR